MYLTFGMLLQRLQIQAQSRSAITLTVLKLRDLVRSTGSEPELSLPYGCTHQYGFDVDPDDHVAQTDQILFVSYGEQNLLCYIPSYIYHDDFIDPDA